ncbi:MAG: alpha/beta hydrolase [Leptolinea sp.]
MPVFVSDHASVFFLDPFAQNQQIVVLLHGLGTEGSSWRYQIQALGAAGFRPIALDLPGFGQSKFTGERWSIKNTARIVMDLVTSLSEERFHLAGISMGGTIALQAAIDFPERIKSLALINTFASLRPKRAGEWYYLLRRYVKARFRGAGSQAELTARRIFPKPEQEILRQELIQHIQQTDPEVYKSAMQALGTFDVRKLIKTLSIPVLVLTGENDTTVPLENQHDLAIGIQNAQQIIIQNAGHGVIIDQPEVVNRNLVLFLSEHSICNLSVNEIKFQ